MYSIGTPNHPVAKLLVLISLLFFLLLITGFAHGQTLEVFANGQSAAKPGPTLDEGAVVQWQYVVTNNSAATLNDMEVRGRQKLPSLGSWTTLCSLGTILPGESSGCVTNDTAVSGTYKSLIVARGVTDSGAATEDAVDAFYKGETQIQGTPDLSLSVSVNGQSAIKPGPSIDEGNAIQWLYSVTNTGTATLNDIAIRGRQKLPTLGNWLTLCTIGTLQAGESGSCATNDTAIAGTYKTLIAANGVAGPGISTQDAVDAFYKGVIQVQGTPDLSLEVSANGQSAVKPGPVVSQGSPVQWLYSVTNEGTLPLSNVEVRGRRKLPTLGSWLTLCTIGTIQVGESGSCTTSDTAIAGTYKTLVSASGVAGPGVTTQDAVDSFYFGDTTQAPPFGLTMRESLAPLTLPSEGAATGNYTLEEKFPNLNFQEKLYITGKPDDDRLVVVERRGVLHAFPNNPSVSQTDIVLDIRDRVATNGELGLLGLVFDPDFAQNRYLYVHYSVNSPRRSVIARFTWNSVTDVIEVSSEKVILEIPQPHQAHNGGMLAFGPDGYLYIALGDGGLANDRTNNSQNKSNLLGSVLRIDVHPQNPQAAYDIPLDNPFVGEAGTREEIYAFGFRNPFRFSFDRQTGDLWLGDVGQGRREEVNLVIAGGNYGWRVFEGTLPFDDSENEFPLTDFIAPVFEYDHSVGFAVIGGYVYRGNDIPSLIGQYLYADFVTGNVTALAYDGNVVTGTEVLATASQPTSFGEDNDGELYIVSRSQGIFGLAEEIGSGEGAPDQLSETGVFTNMATLQPASGLIEYELNHPFYSDNAVKRRWVGVPDAEQVGFDPNLSWNFPLGSVAVKHFEMELTQGDPTSRKRLETRLLVHTTQGWQGFTYRWNAQGSDATLLTGRETETLTITEASGIMRDQLYTYPSRTDCLACHTEAAGFTLGLNTPQLNKDFDYDGVVDNQLRSWNNIAMFSTDIGPSSNYSTYAALEDNSVSVEQRARTYLDVNCAQCHQPQGTTPVDIDLRFSVSNTQMNAIGQTPLAGDLGIAGAEIIKAGFKEESVLWQRMQRLDTERMPPIGSHLVDQQAVDVIGQWIDSL